MRALLDYNPLTKERVIFEATNDGKVVLTHQQDVDGLLEVAHARSVDDDFTKKGIKNDMWHYAKVPNTVILEMKQKHGVDFFDENDAKRVFYLLNTEYARFKTTAKNHMPR